MPSNSGGRKSGKISDKVGMDEKSNNPNPLSARFSAVRHCWSPKAPRNKPR